MLLPALASLRPLRDASWVWGSASRRYAERGINGGGPEEILLKLLLMKSIAVRDIFNAISNRSIFGPR
jgi:hypothetical protein